MQRLCAGVFLKYCFAYPVLVHGGKVRCICTKWKLAELKLMASLRVGGALGSGLPFGCGTGRRMESL